MKKKPHVRVGCVQAAPVYFDLEKTVEKGIRLVEEAAGNGAWLVAFPEVWIPGYPLFAWLNAPIQTLLHMPGYRDNAFVVGGEHDLALRRAACESGIHVCRATPSASAAASTWARCSSRRRESHSSSAAR
ncbi:MAG: hypothetical protein IPP07_18555 [Holophagales bacterium]|nr:hypothetical protein [Holophagales bacterium]MBK9966764.1 hypothetical protein [Holophagales bacterium]